MKLNNKGFAISTVMYMILIMAVILITLTLTLLSSRKLVLEKIKAEAKEIIYAVSLPDSYQQVKYIESDGEQAIRDIYQVPQNYISIKFETKTNTNSRDEQGIMGIKSTIELGYSSVTNRVILWDSTSLFLDHISSTDILNKDVVMEATLTGGNLKVFKLNKNELKKSLADYSSINGKSVDLFVYTGSQDYYFKGKLYYAKIYADDKLVRHMIPCYRKSDGVVGMYDLVEDKFYTNTGLGTFTKGSNVY